MRQREPGRREINSLQKQADQAAALKERAALLLARAEEVEKAREPAFDAFIVSAARAHGFSAFPVASVAAGMEELALKLRSALQQRHTADREVAANESDTGAVVPDDTLINLFVKIGKKTSPEKGALLNAHLHWNGKKEGWTGRVSLAILEKFRAMFQASRLFYSGGAAHLAGNEARPETNTEVSEQDEACAPSGSPALVPAADGESESTPTEQVGTDSEPRPRRSPLPHFPRR